MYNFDFPFDNQSILRNRKKIVKSLLNDGSLRLKTKIAVLAGSTANDIISSLELFLLNFGIEPQFYLSDYNKFWEDGVFGNAELDAFSPDIIYIFTTSRNINFFSQPFSISADTANKKISEEFERFKLLWIKLSEKFKCPIIQNNFELLPYRQLGNSDCWNIYGFSNFITTLNFKMSDYARNNNGFFINDINYLSACYGIEKWHDNEVWCMYKCAMSINAVSEVSYSVACIIKSIYGKNKKVIALDLDNTLWDGVIGDEGVDGIEIGNETAVGQSFSEFQKFIKAYSKLGIILTVCSKNDMDNAISGLNHPDSILSPSDFASIKANWDSKDKNIEASASELSLLTDSFVFVDDNPAECSIVTSQLPEVSAISFESVYDAMYKLSRLDFFEITSISSDDMKRAEMYTANAKRSAQQKQFASYDDYLKSLDMTAIIEDFKPVYLKRITQLTNKSNQFNLTTKRYTDSEMLSVFQSNDFVRLYGRLEDKFGDNGIVSVIIGRKFNNILDIELWLMSCRVLKRNMEFAMLDCLVKKCLDLNISEIHGHYLKTSKNSMVSELFRDFGFTITELLPNGDSSWKLMISDYKQKNYSINVKESEFTKNE